MDTKTIENGFAARAMEVATPLRGALARLNESADLNAIRDGIHPSIRSRVTRALATENPLASLHRMPGPDGLRRVLRVASDCGVSPNVIAECEKHIAEYERFCSTEQISRQTLQAMLAGYLPEARDDAFRASCQSAYKARSIIAGYHAEALLLSLFIYPGTRDDRCNIAVLRGCCSWRRLRPDCMFAAHGYTVREGCDDEHTNIDGVPLSELPGAPLLDEFCSQPPPRFKRVALPHGCNYYLVTDDIGVRSQCTYFVAEVLANSQLRYRDPDPEKLGIAIESLTVSTPCKKAVFDVFIHRDIWPGIAPEIEFFNTVPQGTVNETNYPYRQYDRIELPATLRPLRFGAIETAAVENYNRITERILSSIGFSGEDLRTYRCEMNYPLFGSQAALRIALPERGN